MKMKEHYDSDIINILRLKFGIIGESPALLEVMARLAQAAPTDLAILITGETGTGKEVFANAVHGLSKRKKYPFISVNCGAIPETLLESELFGHEKGAFTGATDQRKGFFEVADKGTIFLDEIGEMPYGTQVKLLRVLESGEFTRLGSTDLKKVDVRVIAATNRELEYEVRGGNFRQDLFFRLNSVHLILPPLRQHTEDIPLLVDYFALKVSSKLGLHYDGISGDALATLKTMPWPGNIRELKNLVETLVTLEQTTYITSEIIKRYIPAALPPAYSDSIPRESAITPYDYPEENRRLELELIFRTLLELKHDINDLKKMMSSLMMDIEALKVDVLELHPEAGHEIMDEESIRLKENDLNLLNLEKQMILFALKKNGGNRRLAARELGMSERTLYRKINGYKIS